MSNVNNRYNDQQNMVLPTQKNLPAVRRMSDAESAQMQELNQPIPMPSAQMPALPQASQTGHLRETFDTRAMAQVATKFGAQNIVVFGVITAAIALICYIKIPAGDGVDYVVGWLVGWGSISLMSLHQTRRQAYDHSPTGVARHEQDTLYAMHDRTAQVEEQKIAAAERVAMAQLNHRRELGMEMLKRLEGKSDE